MGDFVHQINQTLVQYQEDLKTDSDSHLCIITMRKQVPQESQATEEVSLTFIQNGADPFEDWLDKKYLDFGFNAPSLSNTWAVQDHMLSVIATKRYIQTVKEKPPQWFIVRF